MESLTARQRKVLRFVSEYLQRHGYAPSVREVARALNIGTPKGAADHLKTLQRKGYLARTARKPRAMRILHQPDGLPILGRIAAGAPTLAEQNIEDVVPLSADYFGRGEFFALRVRGDSMTGDHIRDGDLAVIRRQPKVDRGQIAAVLIDGEATLKRVHPKGARVELRASNPAYRPIVAAADEVTILGRFAGLIRR